MSSLNSQYITDIIIENENAGDLGHQIFVNYIKNVTGAVIAIQKVMSHCALYKYIYIYIFTCSPIIPFLPTEVLINYALPKQVQSTEGNLSKNS